MKKLAQKFLTIVMAFFVGFGLVAPALNTAPTYATSGSSEITTFGAQAAILTGCADANGGKGEGIMCVVRLVVDILSVLVGIVGIIGIVIVGIQYLTAGGNEEQTRKAKRRLFEIIIGIVVYALIYALLFWLLPDFAPAANNATNNATSLLITTIGA